MKTSLKQGQNEGLNMEDIFKYYFSNNLYSIYLAVFFAILLPKYFSTIFKDKSIPDATQQMTI